MEPKIKCVLIDDQLMVMERLEHLLSKLEMVEIMGKSTIPEKGVDLVESLKPDVLFLDVEMPRLSGFEVVAELKARNCKPEIIFVTAYNQYAIKAIKEQAFDYLLKPIDLDELKETVTRFIQKLETKSGRAIPDTILQELSVREAEVLQHILMGQSSKTIAEEMFISLPTVNSHRQKILQKTGHSSMQELIASIMSA